MYIKQNNNNNNNNNKVLYKRYICTLIAVVHGAMDCGQKLLMLVLRYHQFLSEFLAKGDFLRVSRPLRLSANDKDDEMIPGTVHRSPGIYLTAEEIPENLS